MGRASSIQSPIEDDLGHQYQGGRGSAGFKHLDALNLVWEEEDLRFQGHIDTKALTWQLRVPHLGKIYQGPWRFDIDIPSEAEVPAPVPTTTPTATPPPAALAAVTPTATPGPGGPTPLMQALARVPLAYANQQITFADFAASRAATGLEQVQSMEDLKNVNIFRWNEGIPRLPSSLQYLSILKELTGWDLVASDLGIWSRRPNQGTGSTFLAVQGRSPTGTIAADLRALDYQPVEYHGETYYQLNDDYAVDLRHPLRLAAAQLNRIYLRDGWVTAAPATSIIEQLIDAGTAESPTLEKSQPHQVLAELVGQRLVGGAFVTPDSILEIWNQYYGQRPVERLDRYTSGPDQWGRLSPYSVGLIGYRVQDESEELVIALYYPDPQAAQGDAQELEKRWPTFYQSVVPSGPAETPVTRYCSPMSTRVIEETDYSVLLGTCPLIRQTETNLPTPAPNLWARLLDDGELQFLARDLEELRAGAEQRQADHLTTQEALREDNK